MIRVFTPFTRLFPICYPGKENSIAAPNIRFQSVKAYVVSLFVLAKIAIPGYKYCWRCGEKAQFTVHMSFNHVFWFF